jgi:hypothetical protein
MQKACRKDHALRTATFRVIGASPLLMNSAAAFTIADTGKSKTRQNIPSPEDEAEAGTYRLDDGTLGFPAAAFKKAVVAAAKGRKVGKLGLPGIVLASVFETTEHVPLIHPDTGKPLTDYTIDIRGARPQGQGMVRRARPRLDAWACDIELEYDDELVAEDLVRELLERAGRNIGVGNFRPEKSGRYGRFVVSTNGTAGA